MGRFVVRASTQQPHLLLFRGKFKADPIEKLRSAALQAETDSWEEETCVGERCRGGTMPTSSRHCGRGMVSREEPCSTDIT